MSKLMTNDLIMGDLIGEIVEFNNDSKDYPDCQEELERVGDFFTDEGKIIGMKKR
ncbi:hypothetical protein LCGC14_1421150 [marine sediment metagenome]|uniref:Uncharacterized protein n=1 Tax=marine sediment metagenome TaxID=412755 RepID=A0A0F9MT14_9ZZZZ